MVKAKPPKLMSHADRVKFLRVPIRLSTTIKGKSWGGTALYDESTRPAWRFSRSVLDEVFVSYSTNTLDPEDRGETCAEKRKK